MTMKRTISGMIGAGSLAHNRRDFIAENVDPVSYTHLDVYKRQGFVRVNLAMPRALVAEGLERMAAAVREERRTETACS